MKTLNQNIEAANPRRIRDGISLQHITPCGEIVRIFHINKALANYLASKGEARPAIGFGYSISNRFDKKLCASYGRRSFAGAVADLRSFSGYVFRDEEDAA